MWVHAGDVVKEGVLALLNDVSNTKTGQGNTSTSTVDPCTKQIAVEEGRGGLAEPSAT